MRVWTPSKNRFLIALASSSKTFSSSNLNKSTETVKNIVCKLKDRRNNLEKAGVVYKIECKECESNYVGETGRCLQDRINEHKKDVRKKNERSNIYQHVRNTGHEFKFEEVKVLDEEANTIKRRFLGVHTLMNRDNIYRDFGHQPVFPSNVNGWGIGRYTMMYYFPPLGFLLR